MNAATQPHITPQQVLREFGAKPLSVPLGGLSEAQVKTLAEIEKGALERLTGFLISIFEKSYEIDSLQRVASEEWAQDSISAAMRGIEGQSRALQLEYKMLSRQDPVLARRLLDHSYYNLCSEQVWNDKLFAGQIVKNRAIVEKVREVIDPKGIQSNLIDSQEAVVEGIKKAKPEARQIFEHTDRSKPTTLGKWAQKEWNIMKTNLTERGHGEMMFRTTLVYLGASMSLFSFAGLLANNMGKTDNEAEQQQRGAANKHYLVTAIIGALAAVGAARIGGGKPSAHL